jgi:hypothetical protein
MQAFKLIISTLLLFTLPSTVQAQGGGNAPLGSWSGSAVSFTLYRNGSYSYHDPGATLNGTWNWNPTTAAGGVLMLNYITNTATQNFQNKIYFNITYLGTDDIRFCDPAGNCDALSRR